MIKYLKRLWLHLNETLSKMILLGPMIYHSDDGDGADRYGFLPALFILYLKYKIQKYCVIILYVVGLELGVQLGILGVLGG